MSEMNVGDAERRKKKNEQRQPKLFRINLKKVKERMNLAKVESAAVRQTKTGEIVTTIE